MSGSKVPNLVDKHIGRRVRWRRQELKYSQEHLGSLIGLTFQQIQKYEKGTNRISSGRLFNIAQALETYIGYFYEGVEELDVAITRGVAESSGDELTGLIDADAVDLVVAFQSIPDPKLRKSILSMVSNSAKALGDEDNKPHETDDSLNDPAKPAISEASPPLSEKDTIEEK